MWHRRCQQPPGILYLINHNPLNLNHSTLNLFFFPPLIQLSIPPAHNILTWIQEDNVKSLAGVKVNDISLLSCHPQIR